MFSYFSFSAAYFSSLRKIPEILSCYFRKSAAYSGSLPVDTATSAARMNGLPRFSLFPFESKKLGYYISFLNISSNCSRLAGLGLPGAQASAAADSQRKGRSSSLSFSSLVGMPTSMESWRTASIAALR